MTEFTVNSNRHDPYKNFKFRVKWDDRYIAGISKISALKRVTEVIEYREGGDPSSSRRSAGQTRFEPVTLERGVTHDTAFEAWANSVWQYGAALGAEAGLANFRKDVYLEFLNEAGQLVLVYKIHRCWPSEYVALPELDAAANLVALESITLQNEGFERDPSVTEPQEPSAGAA